MLRKVTRRSAALSVLIVSQSMTGCAIKVDVTSQRTALENQVMGSYAQLDDDLVLNSSVRGNQDKSLKDESVLAKQNQAFNKDDIEELKVKGVLGESKNGLIQVLKSGQGLAKDAKPEDLKLATLLVEEENRDRRTIWKHIISTNESLTDSNMGEVQNTYAKMLREKSNPGHWYELDSGKWQQRVAGENEKPQSVEKPLITPETEKTPTSENKPESNTVPDTEAGNETSKDSEADEDESPEN